MAGIMRLKVGTTKINVSGQRGYRRVDDFERIIDFAQDGSMYQTDFFHKEQYEIPLTVLAAQASRINQWHRDKEEITVYTNWSPGTPGRTISTRITNLQRPFQPIFDFADGSATWSSREGATLVLREN